MILRSLVFFSACLFIACGPSAKTQSQVENELNAPIAVVTIKYEVYFIASRTPVHPPDEFTIDTNGQMVIVSQQLMQDGKWKKPKGLAMIEEPEKAILDSLVADELLYSIPAEDVQPPCSDGGDYSIIVVRKDKKLNFSLKTNTCAINENTLSGRQRVILKRLLQLFESMRVKYRPQFGDR